MPFVPFPPALRHAALPAPELRRDRPRAVLPPPAVPIREQVRLAPSTDLEVARAWGTHVAAGRIGTPAPDPAAGEVRLAGLARILGLPA